MFLYTSYPYLFLVNLYATGVIITVCTKYPKIIILEITLLLIAGATINPIVKDMYDKIFFCFLSFFCNIGTFSVSAGA